MNNLQDILSPQIKRDSNNINTPNSDSTSQPILLSRLQENPSNHTSVISIPRSIVRRLNLSKGQLMSFSLIEDEQDSRIVLKPAKVI